VRALYVKVSLERVCHILNLAKLIHDKRVM
jgi:hypothetical protein